MVSDTRFYTHFDFTHFDFTHSFFTHTRFYTHSILHWKMQHTHWFESDLDLFLVPSDIVSEKDFGGWYTNVSFFSNLVNDEFETSFIDSLTDKFDVIHLTHLKMIDYKEKVEYTVNSKYTNSVENMFKKIYESDQIDAGVWLIRCTDVIRCVEKMLEVYKIQKISNIQKKCFRKTPHLLGFVHKR